MKEKISVCTVSQSFYPYIGGLARYVSALGRRFIREGHEFRVLHFKTKDIPSMDYEEGMQILRVDVSGLSEEVFAKYMEFKELVKYVAHAMEPSPETYEQRFRRGYAEYFAVNGGVYEGIKDVYKHKSFDVLHIHDFQLLPQAFLLEEDLDVPVAFTWHIPFILETPEPWRKFLVKYLKYYGKCVFSTDEYVSAAIKSGLPKSKAVKINPFIDLAEYVAPEKNEARRKYGVGEDEAMVLCVSRIDPHKGQEVLVRAMEKVVEKNKRVKCVFAGNGSFSKDFLKSERGQYWQKIRDLVKELGLEKHVAFPGHLVGNDLGEVYAACDVVVQPSIHEGFGLTVSEGMAFSKPVVASSVGGLKEQVVEGENGFLFKPGDHEELAEKLMRIIEDPALKRKMGERGRKIVEEKFSVEKGYSEYLRLYEELL